MELSERNLSNTETQRDLTTPALNEIKIECIDDEEALSTNFMYSCNDLNSKKYINYYDANFNEFNQLKVEYNYNEAYESTSNVSNTSFDKDLITNDEIKQEIMNIEVELEKYKDPIKTERLDDNKVSDVFLECSVHYDVLVSHEPVQCHLCHTIFINRFELLKHNLSHMNVPMYDLNKIEQNTNDPLKCKYCDRVFKVYKAMEYHIRNVHSENKVRCDLCGKSFKCVQYVRTHMKSIHLPEINKKTLKCNYCDLTFKHKYNLHCHMKTLHDNKIYQCNTCNATFKCKQYLNCHYKRIHYDYGKTFDCDLCGIKCKTPYRLYDHIKTHKLENKLKNIKK